jgi:hypothetical protein
MHQYYLMLPGRAGDQILQSLMSNKRTMIQNPCWKPIHLHACLAIHDVFSVGDFFVESRQLEILRCTPWTSVLWEKQVRGHE